MFTGVGHGGSYSPLAIRSKRWRCIGVVPLRSVSIEGRCSSATRGGMEPWVGERGSCPNVKELT